MSSHLLPPAQWAQQEFGFAQLGDKRRNRRLVKIAENLAANPGGTLPQAFPDWAEAFKTAGKPAAQAQWICIADRESDIYEPMQFYQRRGIDFIIRACQERRLADGSGAVV
ncbi:MAG TPA: transposase DNA-binding-containing protein [Candidatus Angelobacter sp.]|nr:transposase DNA-binding-containing protein [Candidatus Angelobacter sp.]